MANNVILWQWTLCHHIFHPLLGDLGNYAVYVRMWYFGHEHIAIIFFIRYFIIFLSALFLSNVPEFSRFFIVLKIIFIYFTILNIIFFIIGNWSYFILSVDYQEVIYSIKSLNIPWIFNYSFIFIIMSELNQMWQEIIN